MKIKRVRFNINLFLALALLAAGGCQTSKHSKKDKDKEAALVELHVEVDRDGSDYSQNISVFREHPMSITVEKNPLIDTEDMEEASVIEDKMGGFAIQLKYNWRGTLLLESATTANRGKHIAVFCDFGHKRWLAAPLVTKRITDGIFTFTPDATREESDRIVRGLNNFIKEIKKSESL